MIDRLWAESFARDWAANWNAKNLEALLDHYADDVVFRSPRIEKILGKGRGSVSGIGELRAYWRKALDAAPVIRFDILSVGVGGDAITILYNNHRGETVAETLLFDVGGKVSLGFVTYLVPLKDAGRANPA